MAKLHLEGGVTFEGTPEEIKAYTDLYAEKAEEKEPEPAPTFKEGDIVVITGNTNYSRNAVGDIGKITEIFMREARVEVPGGPKLDNWSLFTEMRHATQAEREQYEESLKPKKPQLKAGDLVKFAEDGTDITAGKVYEIKANADGDLYFLDDEGDDRTYPISGDSDYHFEIVKAPKPPSVFERIGRKEGEFKVGDVVRVIGDDVLGGENKDGDIGVVTSVSRWSGIPQVRVSGRDCGNDGNGWFAPAPYFELIAPVESRVDAN